MDPPFLLQMKQKNHKLHLEDDANKRHAPPPPKTRVHTQTKVERSVEQQESVKSFCQRYRHMCGQGVQCVQTVQLPQSVRAASPPPPPPPIMQPAQSRSPDTLMCAAASACNLRAGKTLQISPVGAWSLWDKVQKKNHNLQHFI